MDNEMHIEIKKNMKKEYASISKFTALVYSSDTKHTLSEQVYAAIEAQGVFVLHILHQKEIKSEQERVAVMSCICWTDNPYDGMDISECVKYALEHYGKARMEIFENEQKIVFEFTGDEVINKVACTSAEAAAFWQHLADAQDTACDGKSNDKVKISVGKYKLPDETGLFKEKIQDFLREDAIVSLKFEKDIYPYIFKTMRDNDNCCIKYINLEGTEIKKVIDVLSLINLHVTNRVYLTYEGDISLLDATDTASCVQSIVGEDTDIKFAAVYNSGIGGFRVGVYTCV